MKLMNITLPEEPMRLNVILISGPGCMTQELASYLEGKSTDQVLIVPISYFYPVSN